MMMLIKQWECKRFAKIWVFSNSYIPVYVSEKIYGSEKCRFRHILRSVCKWKTQIFESLKRRNTNKEKDPEIKRKTC